MYTFCPACGFKNLYDSVKPKFCANCGDSFEIKPTSHKKPSPRQLVSEESEEVDSSFDIEALKASVRLEKDGNEGGFMTIGDLQKASGGFERGGSPIDETVRQEVMGTMLNPSAAKAPIQVPPELDKPRSAARKVGKLTR